MKVAFQGERGAYSEVAAIRYFGDNIELLPCKTLLEVFDSVINSNADYAIVPVENSIEGSVNEAYDLLLEKDLNAIGEVYVRIIHCLITYHDNSIDDIRKVYSHPQALGQCRSFINKHGFEAIPYYDTAGSVKMLAENDIKDAAAIASKRAAEIYGLKVIDEGIEDDKNNYTRFLVLSKEEARYDEDSKSMIIFATDHTPGALYKVIEQFAIRSINLTMIVSRPIKGKPWEYNFYLDFEGHIKDEKVKECLSNIKDKTRFLKIIGSYPKARM